MSYLVHRVCHLSDVKDITEWVSACRNLSDALVEGSDSLVEEASQESFALTDAVITSIERLAAQKQTPLSTIGGIQGIADLSTSLWSGLSRATGMREWQILAPAMLSQSTRPAGVAVAISATLPLIETAKSPVTILSEVLEVISSTIRRVLSDDDVEIQSSDVSDLLLAMLHFCFQVVSLPSLSSDHASFAEICHHIEQFVTLRTTALLPSIPTGEERMLVLNEFAAVIMQLGEKWGEGGLLGLAVSDGMEFDSLMSMLRRIEEKALRMFQRNVLNEWILTKNDGGVSDWQSQLMSNRAARVISSLSHKGCSKPSIPALFEALGLFSATTVLEGESWSALRGKLFLLALLVHARIYHFVADQSQLTMVWMAKTWNVLYLRECWERTLGILISLDEHCDLASKDSMCSIWLTTLTHLYATYGTNAALKNQFHLEPNHTNDVIFHRVAQSIPAGVAMSASCCARVADLPLEWQELGCLVTQTHTEWSRSMTLLQAMPKVSGSLRESAIRSFRLRLALQPSSSSFQLLTALTQETSLVGFLPVLLDSAQSLLFIFSKSSSVPIQNNETSAIPVVGSVSQLCEWEKADSLRLIELEKNTDTVNPFQSALFVTHLLCGLPWGRLISYLRGQVEDDYSYVWGAITTLLQMLSACDIENWQPSNILISRLKCLMLVLDSEVRVANVSPLLSYQLQLAVESLQRKLGDC